MKIITQQAADGRWNYGPEEFRRELEAATTGVYPSRYEARIAAVLTVEKHTALFPGSQIALDLG